MQQPVAGGPGGTSLMAATMLALAELEARFPVAQWSVRSLPIWPLLRVRWALGEFTRRYAAGSVPGARDQAATWATRLVRGPARVMRAGRSDGMDASWRPARRDLLFLSDGVSYGQLGGHWIERFCEPIIRAAGERGLSSRLLCPAYALRTPRATPSHFIQPLLDRANLRGALRARLPSGAVHLPRIAAASAWLREQGYNASAFEPRRVLSDATRLLALSEVHLRFLRRTRPRLAFVVSYYGIEGMAFVLACRRARVPLVDLQHGAPGKLHPAYASLPNPPGGLHLLVPDRFWVWSDWERSIIDSWAQGTRHRALAGGDPWMSVWEPRRGWEGVQDAMDRTDALAARAAGRPVILIALQWGFDPGEQLEPMRRLIAAGQDRYAFWVRLHPAMVEQREQIRSRFAAAGRHELDEPTDLPLPALLTRATAHVTHSSSTTVEAAQFGVPTLLTASMGTDLYARQIEAGWAATQTGSPTGMLAALDRLLERRRPAVQPKVPLEETLDELLAETAQGAA